MEGRQPTVLPSNGVPWLIWLGRTDWRCEGCGERGTLPPFREVREFARALGDLKREHAGCGTRGPDGPGIGDPLNLGRAEF